MHNTFPSSARPACAHPRSAGAGRHAPPALPPIYGGGDGVSLSRDSFRIALLAPMCGAAGIWGPSCIANAQLAAHELNGARGVAEKPVEIVLVDSAIEAEAPAEGLIETLVGARAIDAVVGMHISAVHHRLRDVVRDRVPYVYTPVYEGGEATPGVFAIGDTPEVQLGPAIRRLAAMHRPRKWALVGNDYVWPHASNRFAKRTIADLGGEVVRETYLPFGSAALEDEVEKLGASGAEAVLMTLVGQDAVDFNRAFGHAALDRRMIRLSCVLEENCLLACGEGALRRMYSAASYFGALRTDANAGFKERYHAMHGDRAPMLNTIGQSSYEGMHFLAGLMDESGEGWRRPGDFSRASFGYRSVRRGQPRRAKETRDAARASSIAVYLARAEGVSFEIVERLF